MKRSALGSTWTTTIVGGIIATVGGALILDASKVLSLDPLWAFGASVWRWLSTPVSVSLGLLLVLGLALFVFVVMLFSAWWQSRREPTWQTHYDTDTFFNVRWRWRFDVLGQLSPSSLIAFCPQCQGRLIPKPQGGYRIAPETALDCSICDFKSAYDGSESDLHVQVMLRIEQRANSGTWREAVGLGKTGSGQTYSR